MLARLAKMIQKIWVLIQDENGFIRQAYPTPDQAQLTYPYVLTNGAQATDVGAYGRGLYGYAAFGDAQR